MPVATATAVDLTVQIDVEQAAVTLPTIGFRSFFLGVYHGVTILRLGGWKIRGPNPTGPENRHVVTILSFRQTHLIFKVYL